MHVHSQQEKEILKDLGDGLVLRRATRADAEALAAFNSLIHQNEETHEPDEYVAAWTRDLLEKPHPTFQPGDFTIVEDTRQGKIVSSLNLISQTWSYGGIPFGVGRPELVGTLPEYRNRGLIRLQFETIHAWSAERGEMMQAITGIPYYYRLFGYEMALPLGGGRYGFQPQVPKLKEGEQEPYRFRAATEADIPLISALYNRANQRYLVHCEWNDSLWHYELTGRSPQNVNRTELCIIETSQGEPVGYLGHPIMNWGQMMIANTYELKPGVSWAEVTPSVIRFLITTGERLAKQDKHTDEINSFGFWMGNAHPVYEVLHDRLPRVRPTYAWYIRIPDLPGFLRHISPFLEERLAASPLNGHSGEFKVTFYRSGLRLVLEKGRLAKIEPYQPTPVGHAGDAAFPGLTFLQLLMGYRSLDELKFAFADCFYENDEIYALLNILFPKQNSDIWPIS